ncbi:MAG: hypothetical protein JO131_04700 [Gammaproteobacteria bacterium]|nr:hypothetical protein [Gammaproteobacteria bacterium]
MFRRVFNKILPPTVALKPLSISLKSLTLHETKHFHSSAFCLQSFSPNKTLNHIYEKHGYNKLSEDETYNFIKFLISVKTKKNQSHILNLVDINEVAQLFPNMQTFERVQARKDIILLILSHLPKEHILSMYQTSNDLIIAYNIMGILEIQKLPQEKFKKIIPDQATLEEVIIACKHLSPFVKNDILYNLGFEHVKSISMPNETNSIIPLLSFLYDLPYDNKTERENFTISYLNKNFSQAIQNLNHLEQVIHFFPEDLLFSAISIEKFKPFIKNIFDFYIIEESLSEPKVLNQFYETFENEEFAELIKQTIVENPNLTFLDYQYPIRNFVLSHPKFGDIEYFNALKEEVHKELDTSNTNKLK